MKIMYFVDNNLGTVGGEQESTKIIVKGMIENGVDVSVVQPGIHDEGIPKSAQVYLVKDDRLKKVFKKPLLFFYYFFRVFGCVRSFAPRVIHTQAQVSFFIVSLGRMLRLISRDIVFIHTERGIYTKYNAFFRFAFMFFMRELNSLVCTTEANKGMWTEALSKFNHDIDISVIHNTAGANYISIGEKMFDGVLTLGFAGRYCDWKNWPLAEEVLYSLSAKIPELQANMAVGCLDQFSLDSTQAMFSRLKASMGDKFNGVINMPSSGMIDFYKNIDFFILTSWPGTESFGRTVVEAMSSGCVVFVTEGGGPPEVIGDPYFVFKDIEVLVEKILTISRDKKMHPLSPKKI
ncbi:glycosyltransferase family 4 protein [Pseudomonas sp. ABC1]|uniref:glycosyltransferase family 4 protein n=1 Tax=Pseudomonas sp. ABC1 TaxID=2748080 RepID=UPI0015C2ECB3|nr:glycosyltransferase family 4 protein [Pseudomonas sp. ABC1]QLF94495.1 glycosyltransferase family 4 protein [Pseudomonas sp. ABC1]